MMFQNNLLLTNCQLPSSSMIRSFVKHLVHSTRSSSSAPNATRHPATAPEFSAAATTTTTIYPHHDQMETSSDPQPLQEIPGPSPSLPFIGTNWIYSPIGPYSDGKDKMHIAYQNLTSSHLIICASLPCAEKFQDYGPILKEEFQWGKPLVQIYDPRDFEIVLRAQGKAPLRPANEAVRFYRQSRPDRYKSVGLINSQGEEWYRLRKSITPALLKPSLIRTYLKNQDTICKDFVQLIRKSRDCRTGEFAEFEKSLFLMTLESTCMLFLDHRMGCLDGHPPPQALDLIDAVNALFQGYQETYFGWPLWKFYATPAYKRYVAAEEAIYEICSEYIEVKSQTSCDSAKNTSVLDSLLNSGLDKRDIKMSIIDFIMGGIHTSANVIMFFLYQLAKNPAVQRRLQEEIDQVVQDKMAPETLDVIPYLRSTLKETFRLMPVIPNNVRILETDIVIKGYLVPAGTPICCQTYATSLQSEFFPDPLKFKPERWLPGAREPVSAFCPLPFGWGPRMCAGRRFAEQEIFITIARLLQAFDVTYEGEMQTRHSFIIVPAGEHHFVFRPRNSNT